MMSMTINPVVSVGLYGSVEAVALRGVTSSRRRPFLAEVVQLPTDLLGPLAVVVGEEGELIVRLGGLGAAVGGLEGLAGIDERLVDG